MSVVLRRGSNCPLSQTVEGCIPRRGTTSPCQSAATSKIAGRRCSRVSHVSSAISSTRDFYYTFGKKHAYFNVLCYTDTGKQLSARPDGCCDMRSSRIITDKYHKTKHFPLMKCIWRYTQNWPVIILVLIWCKSIYFWRRYAQKTMSTLSFPYFNV